jgi:hypothetical protein
MPHVSGTIVSHELPWQHNQLRSVGIQGSMERIAVSHVSRAAVPEGSCTLPFSLSATYCERALPFRYPVAVVRSAAVAMEEGAHSCEF